MTPKELQQANIERFERLLSKESEPGQRAMLERLLDEERHKDASCYPAARTPSDAPASRPSSNDPRSAPRA